MGHVDMPPWLEQSKPKADGGGSSLCRPLCVKREPADQYVRDWLQDRKDQFMQRRLRPEQVVDVRRGWIWDVLLIAVVFLPHTLDCVILPFKSPSTDTFFPLHFTENERHFKWPLRL